MEVRGEAGWRGLARGAPGSTRAPRDGESRCGVLSPVIDPDPRDAKEDWVSIRVPRGTGDPMPRVSPPALAPARETRGTLSLAECLGVGMERVS